MWPLSSSSQDRSSPLSDAASLAELGVGPWLVQELALSQLRSLQEEVSQASSASAVAVAAPDSSEELLQDDGDARP